MSIIERAAGKLKNAEASASMFLSGARPKAHSVEGSSFDSRSFERRSVDSRSVDSRSVDSPMIETASEKTNASFKQKSASIHQTPTHPPHFDEEGPGPVSGSPHGKVNLARLKLMGALTPDAGRSKIAEEYRLIKRPLLINAFGHGGNPPIPNGNLIMVTSSVPGEGKSFTAINLAISMATELESTVLLIDADVAKSSVIQYLGLEADRGLLDVLRDPEIELSDTLIKTDIAKLTVLPSGRGFTHATELLASSSMRDFVKDISTRYRDRIIIFDCPPILATSEATVLASYMGQIVFVVEAERTPQEAVKDALAHLSDCEHVGILLNKAPSRAGGGDYYSYGYGYGYGYGGYGEYGKQ
jgi:protein-tyrosine kinase